MKKRAKFEYAIGLGITTIIINYIVKGIDMPSWAGHVLMLLIVAYFVNWAFQLLEHFVESEVNNRAAPITTDQFIRQQRFMREQIPLESDSTAGKPEAEMVV